MIIKENILGVNFPNDKSQTYVKNILDYLHFTDPLYYYLFFGYSDGNVDIEEYCKKYPELLEDKGFIRLYKEDIHNYRLIYDLLFNYQLGSLYINTYQNLDKKYKFEDIRDGKHLFEGYVILEMKDYIAVIQKASGQPDWDLEKMGIPKELIIAEDTSQERQSGNILTIIKNIFTRLK